MVKNFAFMVGTVAWILAITLPPHRAYALETYVIEVSHNDELFIINGEKFEAQSYCFDVEAGDPVVFIDGSPNGVCVSATVLNLRTQEKCDVWCE